MAKHEDFPHLPIFNEAERERYIIEEARRRTAPRTWYGRLIQRVFRWLGIE